MSDFELSVTRHIAAPPTTVWHAMIVRMEEWWCPRPWRARIVQQDLRAGGRACMEMIGPAGESMINEGLVLEYTPERRFVITDAFTAGWQPAGPFMVGIFEIEPEGAGTRYTARARHWTEAACVQHKEMGFEAGWSAAAAQLAELVEAG
jgi:uncharacterized protein YndB with AHSA1/START domain